MQSGREESERTRGQERGRETENAVLPSALTGMMIKVDPTGEKESVLKIEQRGKKKSRSASSDSTRGQNGEGGEMYSVYGLMNTYVARLDLNEISRL